MAAGGAATATQFFLLQTQAFFLLLQDVIILALQLAQLADGHAGMRRIAQKNECG
jgi:hypothetical protein